MSLTYDQKSEIRLAFDEAFVEPERRRSLRYKHITQAQISEWQKGKVGVPFDVQIEDFSPMGVGMIHGTPLPVGGEYLIKVPRQKWGDLVVLMTVVRAVPKEDGTHHVGLEISNVLDQSALTKFCDDINGKRLTSRRTKLLFILFGIIGIAAAVYIR